ncbi:AfsR/SARP family transcriptional regulator [Lentzea aerocolonigenes]|uniref:AfsR/SARP family transcriptional regulator n=1 Tax=Lentzea aerocolonigenes TaxID=68170 RepID=UPI0004C3826D|nr:BTAD domain-containing putative transcriptional regulator [Lentzea aerocolonigenes]MCP2246628.1 DNA-binding transcriptional activator of the SARP family [Lentzea aerocolonigenes]
MAVELRVLGDVEAWIDGRRVEVGHARQRCVLAVMALEANRVVTVDQLLDRVWSAQLPHQGRQVVRTYVSRLRRLLAPGGVEIERRPGGYVLLTDPDNVDVHRFHRLVTQARAAGDERAIGLFDQALALWSGEPFTGLETPWLATVRAGLEREHLAARLDHVDVALRCGEHTRLLPELSTLAGENPLDERIAGQLVLALYRAGRQADALAHYQRTRRLLAEELGTDPGPQLRQLHQRILGADPTLAPGPVSSVVPRQLPAAPWAFTGRTDHLAALTAALDHRGTVVISAIRGTGGIGKTWLTLAWAHRHLDQFPDGQLFVDLRGFSPDSEPVAPAAAVRGFLDALGVEPDRLPSDPQAQVGLFRSLVARRRMLIVLDNAADAEQVTPLLPGGDSCTVVITSRRTLTGLISRHGALHLSLDTLSTAEAHALLVRRLGTSRIAAEPEAVADLVRRCGGLPLALGIIAGRAHGHPHVPLAEFAADLRDLGLGALEDDDPATGLPTVLSWSLRGLTTEQQVAFGLLGVAPGPDISLLAAAALTGLSVAQTRKVLRGLEEASLLGRSTHGRYRMHDLVRRYATSHHELPDDVRQAALRRVIDFYLHTAHAADHLLNYNHPDLQLDPPECRPLELPDLAAALAWLEAEHACLLAAQHTAAVHDWHRAVWQLAWTVSTFHTRRGRLRDRLTVWQAGLSAAEQLNDPASRALAHRLLGLAHSDLGLHDEAIGHLRKSLTVAEQHQDAVNQAHTHRVLGLALEKRDCRRALDHATRALELYRGIGNPVWEACALNDVGLYAGLLGDHDEGRAHCEAALVLFRRHDDLTGEADALDSLGHIAHHAARHDEAIHHYQQALTLRRHLGATYGVADILDGLASSQAALGRRNQARAAWCEALELYRDQGRDEDADRVQRQLDAVR